MTRPTDAASAANTARAKAWAARLAPTIAEIQATGITSLIGIARALNRRHVATRSRRGKWSAAMVARLLARIGA
jgi:hypothetical protein